MKLELYDADQRNAVDELRRQLERDFPSLRFSYFAKYKDGNYILIAGNVSLLPFPEPERKEHFVFGDYCAGFLFSPIDLDVAGAFMNLLKTGQLEVDGKRFLLPGEKGKDRLSLYVDDRHPSNHENFIRSKKLLVQGEGIHKHLSGGFNASWLDREIKLGEQPFIGHKELFDYCGIGDGYSSQSCSVQFSSLINALIKADRISFGDGVSIPITASKSINVEDLSAHVVLKQKDRSQHFRKTIGVEEAEEQDVAVSNLVARIDATEVEYIYVTLSYKKNFIQQCYVENQNFQTNLDFSVLDHLDDGLERLQRFISPESQNDENHFESGVHFLLFLLGLRSMHFGNAPKYRNGSDIIFTTGGGKYFLCECTVGIPEGKKISSLSVRSKKMQSELRGRGFPFAEVVPILFSSQNLTDLGSVAKECSDQGVAICDRKKLEALFCGSRNAMTVEERLAMILN